MTTTKTRTRMVSDIDIGPGGTSNDTAIVQAALDVGAAGTGCEVVGRPGVTYTVDTLTVYSKTMLRGNHSIFQQRTANTPVLDINNRDDVTIDGVYLKGNVAVATNFSATNSGDKALKISNNSSNITVKNSTVTRFAFIGLWAEQSVNINFCDNLIFENSFGTWFRGVSYGKVTGNRIRDTCMYSLTPSEAQLTSGVALESTDGHAFGVCKHIVIANNVISGLPYSQAIFAHAGKWVTIANNVMINVSIAVSLNAFNATDELSYIAVTGNVGEGTLASSLPTESDVGVNVQGGGPTPLLQKITVTGNTMHAFNRVSLNVGLGGYVFQATSGLIVSGNVADSCGGNGFVFVDAEEGASVVGNSSMATVAIGTTQNGYLWSSAPRALFVGNMSAGINGANGVGNKVVGALTNMLRANNHTYDVTTPESP